MPDNIAELADRAQRHNSIVRAIEATNLPEYRVLQLVVCCPPNVPVADFARCLPDGTTLPQVEPLLQALEDAALVWRHDDRLHTCGSLRIAMPTRFGPPLSELLKNEPVDYLISVIRKLRDAAPDPAVLPRQADDRAFRPPRKGQLIDELEALVAVPGLVDVVLRRLGGPAAALARRMADGRPVIETEFWLHHSAANSALHGQAPVYQLFERAFLLPGREAWTAVQPREVALALLGGRPVADLALHPPAVVTGTVDQDEVDARATAEAASTLDRLADLLDRWTDERPPLLKSHALGVAALKATSAALGLDVETTTRLVELSFLAGLIEKATVTSIERRKQVYVTSLGPSAGAHDWLDRARTDRLIHLAGAWLRAERRPSAPTRKTADGKSQPALTAQYDAVHAPEQRREVLSMLAELPPRQRSTAEALAAAVEWQCPRRWFDDEEGEAFVGDVLAEAELLGIVADGALSTFGRALLAGNLDAARRSLESTWPASVDTFTLQADLTATVVGALERDVLVELRLLADQESSGAAATYRFSEASLRRALDAGRNADGIVAFLTAHAAKGVPKPLAYLVRDVARRYGHLQVVRAASVVTSDDPAVLADACSNRRTRKLNLRLLAPTVALSDETPDKVMAGLREAGFLPTGDGANATITARTIDLPSQMRGELREPYRSRDRQGAIAPIGEDEAVRLAKEILTGPQPTNLPQSRRGITTTDELLERASDEMRVLKLFPDDGPPVLVEVTGWDGDHLDGIAVVGGEPLSFRAVDIRGFVDLGPERRP